jgi:hypothetical protein
VSYPPCAQTGQPPCINDAGETVDPSRGPWWAHPMVTKLTLLPPVVTPARVAAGRRQPRSLRGMGFTSVDDWQEAPDTSASASSGGSTASSGGDYCIELSSGSILCFSLWTVALVAGVGIFALAMLSGGRGRR